MDPTELRKYIAEGKRREVEGCPKPGYSPDLTAKQQHEVENREIQEALEAHRLKEELEKLWKQEALEKHEKQEALEKPKHHKVFKQRVAPRFELEDTVYILEEKQEDSKIVPIYEVLSIWPKGDSYTYDLGFIEGSEAHTGIEENSLILASKDAGSSSQNVSTRTLVDRT
ncbi:hypothetical protein BC567DRAFT_214390 [Phyllosticta citribraziliensis]